MKEIAEKQFIGEYYMSERICDDLIRLHKSVPFMTAAENPEKKYPFAKTRGHTGGKAGQTLVRPEVKDSVDVCVGSDVIYNPKTIDIKHSELVKIIHNYYLELSKTFNVYAMELGLHDKSIEGTMENTMPIANINEGFNIQHYKPGEGYYAWHTERTCQKQNREYVFMTYLNDVPDGGTEFYYQEITAEAKKGKTLIWPAHYTHIHRGQISKTSEKYIATGWLSYPPGG